MERPDREYTNREIELTSLRRGRVFVTDNEDEEIPEFAGDAPSKRRVPSFNKCKRLRCYVCYVALVLVGFGVVLFFAFSKYDSLTNAFSGLDITNHNYTLLVAAYQPIAAEMYSVMNSSAAPCDDFYTYACGAWIENTPLDPDVARITRAFAIAEQENLRLLREVVNGDWPIIAPYFTSCNAGYTNLNFSLVQPLYDRISGADSSDELFRRLAQIRGETGMNLASFLCGVGVELDLYTPTRRIFTVTQPALPLPSPEYYMPAYGLIDNQEYYRYITSLFALSPGPIGVDEAIAIHAYEAAVSQTLVDSDGDDVGQMYHRVLWQELRSFTPREVVTYVNALSLVPAVNRTALNLESTNFFVSFAEILRNVQLPTLKNIALYSLFRHTYPLLGPQYFDAQRGLRAILEGVSHRAQTKAAREVMCLRQVASDIGQLTAHYYVLAAGIDDAFKSHVADIVVELKTAFELRLENNSWMDRWTKTSAEGKLAAIRTQICYPDAWDDVVAFEQQLDGPLSPDNYFANAVRLARLNDLNLFSPAQNWDGDSPTVVNAFYAPQLNQITLPAGITQPPFLYAANFRGAPLATLYAGIGAVGCHELTHGFDDNGRRYAADGAYADWWSQESSNAFSIAARCLVNFYSGLVTQVDGLYVNGDRTLGENIADLGGLEQAYDAFLVARSRLSTVDRTDYDGAIKYAFPKLKEEQLFFIFWAQLWCEKSTDDAVRELVESNPHPPARNRVEGVLMNMPRFAEAFGCAAGDRYVPRDRCRVW